MNSLSTLLSIYTSTLMVANIQPIRVLNQYEGLIANKSSDDLAIRSSLRKIDLYTSEGKFIKNIKTGSLDLPIYLNSDGKVICKVMDPKPVNNNIKYADEPYDYFFSGGSSIASYDLKSIRVRMEYFNIPYSTSASAIAVNDDNNEIFVLNAMSKETHVSIYNFSYGEPVSKNDISLPGPIYASQFINSAVWIDESKLLVSLRSSELIKSKNDLNLLTLSVTKKLPRYQWNYLTILDIKRNQLRAIAKFPASPFDLDANPVGGRLVLAPSKKIAYLQLYRDVFAVSLNASDLQSRKSQTQRTSLH